VSAGLRQELESAAEGLVYSSESDRPFHYFELSRDRLPADLTPASFAGVVGAEDARVEEWSLDRFLAPHIHHVHPLDGLAWERVPRYDALRSLLLRELRNVRVFRVGEVAIRCFVVGRDGEGNLVGLETVAVET
jgi:hypothetical protein